MERRLYRSRDDRMIWGVCGGIAKYFGIDPTLVRLIAIALLVLSSGFALIAYIILAIVIPLESSAAKEPREVVRENVAEIKQTATQFGEDVRSTFTRHEGEPEGRSTTMRGSNYFIAVILIVLGVLFLLGNLNFFSWFAWNRLWPLILIAIGMVIIFGARRR